ncbi:hypothetical protein U9M48_018931 [Paspalum notatum var. saurae]|uniref:Endonuclease/exonuclease/phosphatase domain-containing protein n=1 Tax=Paspalum notatum var. saurae TaxID=547442 RepID=A0AAQ3TE79_PASNO
MAQSRLLLQIRLECMRTGLHLPASHLVGLEPLQPYYVASCPSNQSSTKAQSIHKPSLINKLGVDDAFVLPSVGLSGVLCLLWKEDFSISVDSASLNLILATATYKPYGMSFNLICMYGDPNHSRTDEIWQIVLNFIAKNPHMPVLCMGDMNNIMNVREKLGSNLANCARISNFCVWIKECGLFDLGYHGPAYTWTNKRFSSYPTFERLDICLANLEWAATFPNTIVHQLPMLYSDHCPILITIDSPRQKVRKPFRFENWWLQESDFQQVNMKTTYLATDLKKWRRKKYISEQLTTIENQLSNLQAQTPTLHNHRSQSSSNNTTPSCKRMKNTIGRGSKKVGVRKNTISFVITQDGNSLTTNDQIAQCFKSYFTNLFTSRLSVSPQHVQDLQEL